MSWSNSGQQALIYAISTDLEAFLETARRLAPSEGVAAFTAKVWESDPRHADVAPQEVALADPQPAWPKPGYGEDVARVLAESQASPQSRRPEPDLHKLVAQFSASTHRLEFELLASHAPFERAAAAACVRNAAEPRRDAQSSAGRARRADRGS